MISSVLHLFYPKCLLIILPRVAEPEILKTVPVLTFYLITVSVPVLAPVQVPALVPGHIHAYTYTNTVRGMCTPYMFYSDIELKKFKLKISKITITISALWPCTIS
jgi:hypothetical protein